jgi:hypothetical protein
MRALRKGDPTMTATTNPDDNVPANRVLGQWKAPLWREDGRGYREVLVTQYGDGSLEVAWRPDHWSTWSPPTGMVEQ